MILKKKQNKVKKKYKRSPFDVFHKFTIIRFFRMYGYTDKHNTVELGELSRFKGYLIKVLLKKEILNTKDGRNYYLREKAAKAFMKKRYNMFIRAVSGIIFFGAILVWTLKF